MKDTKTAAVPIVFIDTMTIEAIILTIVATTQIQPSDFALVIREHPLEPSDGANHHHVGRKLIP
jgi:hypothetical protein